jgi:hypothetical protein
MATPEKKKKGRKLDKKEAVWLKATQQVTPETAQILKWRVEKLDEMGSAEYRSTQKRAEMFLLLRGFQMMTQK